MSEENEDILRRWIEDVWNHNRQETIEELFDKDGTAVSPINPPERPIKGVDGVKLFLNQMRKIFSDIHVSIEDIFAEGERVVALCHFSARHKQFFSDGTMQILPIQVSGLCQIIVRDGKIFYSWNNLDLLGAL